MAETTLGGTSAPARPAAGVNVALVAWLGLSALIAVFLPTVGVLLARDPWFAPSRTVPAAVVATPAPSVVPAVVASWTEEAVPMAEPLAALALEPAVTESSVAEPAAPESMVPELMPQPALSAEPEPELAAPAMQVQPAPAAPRPAVAPTPVPVMRQVAPTTRAIVPTVAPAPSQPTAAKADFAPPTPRVSQPPKPTFSPPH